MKKKKISLFPFLIITFFFFFPIVFWLILSFTLNEGFLASISGIKVQLFNTFCISISTCLLSVLIAYPVSYLYWSSKNWFKSFITILVFTPVTFGLLTRNFAWIGLMSDNFLFGYIKNNPLNHFLYTFEIIIFVMVFLFVPLAYFILIHGFQSIHKETISSAKVMGANFYEIFLRIIFPQTQRQVFIAFLFIFSNSLGFYITPKMLGGGNFDMIGNVIEKYLLDLGDYTTASNISILVLIVNIPIIVFAFYQIKKFTR